GTFELVGLPPAPRGVPQIEVSFDIDANGIVHVSAKDLGTGTEQSITITGGSGLSKEEIDRMMKDAEAHAAEDATRKEAAEIRNTAETLVYQTEKFVKENDEKISAEQKQDLETALEELKTAVANDDDAAIKAGIERVSTLSQEIGAAMYASNAADESGQGETSDDEDIVEGEVIDEDEKK
ncbi:MAG: molecular chaperone DnaK, partial [Actinomycetota bacterium]